MPRIDGQGKSIAVPEVGLVAWFTRLAERLQGVRLCCGDWTRVVGETPLRASGNGVTGVFFDPPYGQDGGGRDSVYGEHESATVAADVRAWCLARGDDPRLRLCLAGYAGEGHEALEAAGWECVPWRACGGYGNQRRAGEKNTNGGRERLWFSPHCLAGRQQELPISDCRLPIEEGQQEGAAE